MPSSAATDGRSAAGDSAGHRQSRSASDVPPRVPRSPRRFAGRCGSAGMDAERGTTRTGPVVRSVPFRARSTPSAWPTLPGPAASRAVRRARAASVASQREPLVDLERPDEHGLRLVARPGHHVHAVVQAVDQVDVQVPGRAEHHLRCVVSVRGPSAPQDPRARHRPQPRRSVRRPCRPARHGPGELPAGRGRRRSAGRSNHARMSAADSAGERDHGTRRSAISLGTKGRARNPAVGINVSRKYEMRSESLSAS